ncbi:hypothetical protein HPB47_011483 [Ixodes persulcatus]|uniref:Uncharacterized protein n=1 Tax=Ixodes persulcatus TaxID=34615 RepID=A0AC60NW97_IXOPE|nr:hypothetical protein HPB47_011483 [Ixodes persulcatus]
MGCVLRQCTTQGFGVPAYGTSPSDSLYSSISSIAVLQLRGDLVELASQQPVAMLIACRKHVPQQTDKRIDTVCYVVGWLSEEADVWARRPEQEMTSRRRLARQPGSTNHGAGCSHTRMPGRDVARKTTSPERGCTRARGCVAGRRLVMRT